MRETPPLRFLVLVVDDSRDSAESLALLVRLWGHEAVVTYDGPSALEAAHGCPPDVVLFDIALAGVDGYQLARRLRRMAGMEKALLVAVTGLPPDLQRCQGAGIDCQLLKPVGAEELKQVLVRAESLARGQRQGVC
jgi:CheY-like chemotaxis protein